MKFLVIPYAVAGAAENMARDWLMLEGWVGPDYPRLRTYGWARPAWTCGYSQAWAAVAAQIAQQAKMHDGKAELVRRATGGGVVDHRDDWTYALVMPAAHAWSTAKAAESYRMVHEALAAALRAQGVPLALAGTPESAVAGLGVCFTRAERNDLVRTDNGAKIAGAAQKRNRQGMLFQGSVSRAAAPEVRDWAAVEKVFAAELGQRLELPVETWAGAPWAAPALAVETARYASREWNEER